MDEHEATHLERLERRIEGLDHTLSVNNQLLSQFDYRVKAVEQMIHGVDGLPGLRLDVDRLKNLGINERFVEQGKKIEGLERWQAKIMGASVLGSVIGSALMRLWR